MSETEFDLFTPPSPKAAEQLGILILDGSGSMKDPDLHGRGTKAQAVSSAVQELVIRLKKSARHQDFWLSLIAFDNKAEIRLPPTPVTEIDLNNVNTNPLLGGTTAIGDALNLALSITDEFLAGQTDLQRMVVMMLMSDGQSNNGANPLSVANEIKNKFGMKGSVNIVTVAYGQNADSEVLKGIASDPIKGFCETDEAAKLRDFFVASLLERDRA